jgi:hypothetical protein
MLDLTRAVVVTAPDQSKSEKKAVAMLVEEVEARTRVRWRVVTSWPEKGDPVVAVGPSASWPWAGAHADALSHGSGSNAPEGYRIAPLSGSEGVAVLGADSRGILFGVGRLLRELRMGPGRIELPSDFKMATRPRVALRGHQLGYRPKTNSYDAWDLPQWEQYIRDLAVFGTNAVELVPPRTDDDADSPHFPRPPLEMMVGMSRLLDDYGLDVWVWFPAMDADYTDPAKVESALKEWDGVFRALPRLDAVFVPGGDPGHTQPKVLLAFLEKVTDLLHKSHPKGQMWVSPQGFNGVWMDEFLGLMKAEPSWLTGIVFGPQVRTPLVELRKAIPARYAIRGYPDITHSRQCQHPVADWDLAYAVTEGREAINPRPLDQAAIFESYRKNTVGFITYSEGCNDDVNKVVWSALGWDPDADVVEILRQYSRYLIQDRVADSFAGALLALERNWQGPLLTNAGVETTLSQLRDLERAAGPSLRRNWRFQQALYRAHYDAYIRDRLVQETALEARAREILRNAPRLGTSTAIGAALATLNRSIVEPVSLDRRARVFELGDALFQSIRMQLSVSKHLAIAAERGANLDTIDVPLNNRLWFSARLAEVSSLPAEPDRLRALDALLNRADPGPGGFYDDLGDPSNSPHLVRTPTFADDPMLVRAPFQGFALRADWPTAWRQYAQAFYDAPLQVHYEGLDPRARYRVRVTYAGDSPLARMLLLADSDQVHPLTRKPEPIRPVEFEVPPRATADGRLTLTWTQEPGRGGNGRGCQVAEVWLIRE